MVSITHSEFVAAYSVARLRELGRLSDARAKQTLTENHGMNRSSANDYIDAYRHMRRGEVFKRTINADAARHYVERIRIDFGEDAAVLALRSLDRHIGYYEPVRGARCVSLRQVADTLRAQISQPAVEELARLQSDLELAVAASMRKSPSARRAMLPKRGHKPTTATVTTTVFVRNAAVIAEVLLRANGVCESCGDPAPFIRRSDSSPYLEIHHKQRLADGGDDTVENSEALCPNCHRQRHFGAPRRR